MRNQATSRISTLFFLTQLFLASQILAQPDDGRCEHASHIALNETMRIEGSVRSMGDLFVLEIPSSGLLGIEVQMHPEASAEPILAFLGSSCRPLGLAQPIHHDTKTTTIDHSARSHLLVIHTPGDYFVRVMAGDPAKVLDRYKLGSRFLDGNVPALFPKNKSDDDDEIDIDDWDEEILSVIAATDAGDAATSRQHTGFCHPNPHLDTDALLWCATPMRLGSPISSVLSSPRRDDVDTFVFTLTTTELLRIESHGTIDTFATLSDALGNRIAVSDHGGESENFRLLRVLSPGRYTVRIESLTSSEGRFELAVRRSLDRAD